MNGGSLAVVLMLAAVLELETSWAGPATTEELVETGRLLALLLDAGRITIANKQPLFNDRKRGDKGYSPVVFEQELSENFRQRTGLNLFSLQQSNVREVAKQLLPSLVQARQEDRG
jgi:hypothetical protein